MVIVLKKTKASTAGTISKPYVQSYKFDERTSEAKDGSEYDIHKLVRVAAESILTWTQASCIQRVSARIVLDKWRGVKV